MKVSNKPQIGVQQYFHKPFIEFFGVSPKVKGQSGHRIQTFYKNLLPYLNLLEGFPNSKSFGRESFSAPYNLFLFILLYNKLPNHLKLPHHEKTFTSYHGDSTSI